MCLAIALLLLAGEWFLITAWQSQHLSFLFFLTLEALFHLSVFLLFQASSVSYLPGLFYCLAGIWLCCLVLNVSYLHVTPTLTPLHLLNGHGESGDIGLWLCCLITFYRLPIRWAFLLAVITFLLLAGTSSANLSFSIVSLLAHTSLLISLIGALICCALGWIQRKEAELFLELQEVQALLRWQIEQIEKQAVKRERTRIARDIHDILAHSFALLSIQLQAAFQLIPQGQDQLTLKLEEIAILLDESMAESHRVIDLLRDLAPRPCQLEPPGIHLQRMLMHFCELTGIQCFFEEEGKPGVLDDEQSQALSYALREALTNASLHGQAQRIWVSLHWETASIAVHVRNNRQNIQPGRQEPLRSRAHDLPRGHYGLRGMRERATLLGGNLVTASDNEEEFTVVLTLPRAQP